MYPYHKAMDKLRIKNEGLSERRKALKEVAVQFKTGLVCALSKLAQRATEEYGLPNVEMPKLLNDSINFLEVKFTFNNFQLVLVSNYDSFPEDSSGKLVSKFFVYVSDSEESTPLFEISIQELGNNTFRYHADWYSTDKKNHLKGGDSVTQDDGAMVANELFDFLYSWDFTWTEKPTLAAIRTHHHKEQFGFQTSKPTISQ